MQYNCLYLNLKYESIVERDLNQMQNRLETRLVIRNLIRSALYLFKLEYSLVDKRINSKRLN